MRFNIPHGNTLRKPFISNLKGDDVRTRMNEAEIASESSVQKFVNKVSCSRTVPNFKSKEKRHPQIFSYRILLYIHISPRGVVSFDFRSWISLSGSKPNVSTSKSVQPHRLYNKREREKRKRKKNRTKILDGWPFIGFVERERKGKKERQRERRK